jgi:Trk K+ transport system NAD-binding subunit
VPQSPWRNLVTSVIFLLAVMSFGVAGYMGAGWHFGDALFMVIITIFTVGYNEVHPLTTPWLHALTIALIILGCTGMIVLTGTLVQALTMTQLQQFLGIKRMKTEIEQLRDHVIVCGFGRIGRTLARELRAAGTALVIIDRNEKRVAEAREQGYLCIQGEATDESLLTTAGIQRARVLATVLPDDAANVFITLGAHSLNPSLEIIARGELPATEGKLLHAGASKVVLPTHIGAERIAEMILYPETSTRLRNKERMRGFEHELHGLGLDLEVVVAAEGGKFTGLSIEQAERAGNGAFLIVGLNRRDGTTVTRPSPDTAIEPGDGVVIISRSGHVTEIDGFADTSATQTRPG